MTYRENYVDGCCARDRDDRKAPTILLLHEFGPKSRDWHQGPVAEQLQRLGWHVSWKSGWMSDYRAGGVGFARLGNLFYCYIAFPWHLWRQRPSAVLVRTAPPGIQVWLSFWAAIQRRKVIWWLMDYHPEIEARLLEERGWVGRRFARMLRLVDRCALDRTHAVIAIDEAMAGTVRAKSCKPRIGVYTTWSPEVPTEQNAVAWASEKTRTITLLHLGNYSFAHSLDGLKALIDIAPAGWGFRLIVVNPSERGRARFNQLADGDHVQVEFHPKQSLETLEKWIVSKQINWGLVTLDPRFSGTLSPSKFHTYLDLNLPLLYFGPHSTNAALYCEKYGAGLAVPPGHSQLALQKIIKIHEDQKPRQRMFNSVLTARKRMHASGAQGFCELLVDLLKE